MNNKGEKVGDIIIRYTFNDTLSVRRHVFAEAWARLGNIDTIIPVTTISETGARTTTLESHPPEVLAIHYPTARQFEDIFDFIQRPENYTRTLVIIGKPALSEFIDLETFEPIPEWRYGNTTLRFSFSGTHHAELAIQDVLGHVERISLPNAIEIEPHRAEVESDINKKSERNMALQEQSNYLMEGLTLVIVGLIFVDAGVNWRMDKKYMERKNKPTEMHSFVAKPSWPLTKMVLGD